MADTEPVTLQDPASSLSATYVPGVGMICTSLRDGEVEFLGQRRGLEAYISAGKTMGIPILYPWANRLSGNEYEADGTVVTLTGGTDGVRTDEHGAPIHGVAAANPDWVITERTGNRLVAELQWAGHRLLATFPFPHVLTVTAAVAERTLTVDTSVAPTSAAAVPLCFGYHPYLQLTDVPRAQWRLETPDLRHLPVDARGIPTGETNEWLGGARVLGDSTLDDGFDRVPEGAVFTLSGGDRRVDVTFARGYSAAQLFAPATDDVIGIEPMAARTDALRRGTYAVAAPGTPHTSSFSITIS